MSKLGVYFKGAVDGAKEASAPDEPTVLVEKLASLGVKCAKAFVVARETVADMGKEELAGFGKAAEYGRDLAREHFVAELEKAASDESGVSEEDVNEAKVLVAASAAQALMSELDEDEASDPAVQEHVIRVAAEIAESNFDPAVLFGSKEEDGDEDKEAPESKDDEPKDDKDKDSDADKKKDKKEEEGK